MISVACGTTFTGAVCRVRTIIFACREHFVRNDVKLAFAPRLSRSDGQWPWLSFLDGGPRAAKGRAGFFRLAWRRVADDGHEERILLTCGCRGAYISPERPDGCSNKNSRI
ncbi:hypothetical protein GWI33_016687 [Rhynchophorus ferrugineus]|uniref:Uncharacterized protein n=1 Tax=Rhynchophorus ferrugineus TaxID=354439 RepID=A0A834M6X0_RHYFE|nr:hypothetical protein GWI33_016687 [Rhynchophorus ferrugineus]